MNTRRRPLLALAALVAGLGALSLASATAQSPAGSSQPLKIGIVDLGRMGDKGGLTEAADINERLAAEHRAAQSKLDEVVEQLKKVQKDMENVTDKNSPQYWNLWSQGAELEVQARARKQALERVFDQQKGVIMADMYGKMVAGIGEFGKQESFDLLLVDDRGGQVPADRGADIAGAAIQGRKVLFAAPRLDVTDQVITFMNNRYRAGVRTPAAAPIPPTPGATGSLSGPTIAPATGATGRTPR